MKQPSEPGDWDDLRDRIIGFGETSIHKSYYPELQKQMADLERFRALLDESHDAVYLIDVRSGVVVDANRPAWDHFGYLQAGVVGRPFIDLIVPSERPRFLPFIAGSARDRDALHTIVLSLRKAIGGTVPVEATLHAVHFGDEFYIVAVARDITRRREAEKDLRIKESAIRSSSDGILIVDPDGGVIYANEAFGRMFGFSDAADLKGTRIEGLLEMSDGGPGMWQALWTSQAFRTETKARRREGTVFDLRVSGSAVPDDDGRPLCLMFVCQDITGLKAMEEMRRRAYEQLEQNIEQFAVLGDHIRNPLQVIVGLACMIDDPVAAKIVEQCTRVNGIITELDRGWVMSENVRQYLRRREGIDLRAGAGRSRFSYHKAHIPSPPIGTGLYMRTPINEVTPETGRAEVAGWVHEIRDLGGLTFFLIRDRTGIIQVTVVKKKASEAVLQAAKAVSRESIVRVSGTVKPIEKAPGGRELTPETFEIVSPCESPLPLDVVEKVPADLDTRLDARFLDVRKPRVAAIFKIRSAVTAATYEFFSKRGYYNITSPKVVAAATEGGTELFPIAYFEKEAFLNQSPQLYKQMMMAAGFEKVFEIGPIFRAEEHNTVRHLNEATSIDVEVSFADHNDVMKVLEDLVSHQYATVAETCSDALADLGVEFEVPKAPFPRIPYADAIDIAAKKIDEPIAYGDDLSTPSERAIGEEMGEHYFIVDWPSAIRPYYAMPYEDDPSICKAFDMMHPRMELSSGAQRVHQYDLLVDQIKAKGLSPESFEFYLQPFRYGMPPHAGWGMGMERLIMTMLGLQNIREAVLFPRDRHRVVP